MLTLAYKTAFVLATVFQVILCEHKSSPPPECREPPPETDAARSLTCCVMSPLISNETLAACGYTTFENQSHKGHHKEPEDCTTEQCVAKDLKFANEDGETLDMVALSAFLDNWVKSNPRFDKALEIAKKHCLAEDVHGPPGMCMIKKVRMCISNVLITYCPEWKETEACTEVKNYWDECKKYFPFYE